MMIIELSIIKMVQLGILAVAIGAYIFIAGIAKGTMDESKPWLKKYLDRGRDK